MRAEDQEATHVLSELLARPTLEGVLEGALAHAVTMLGGDMRGYAVIRRGQDEVAAVHGYPRALVGVPLSGPWSQMRTRVLPTGATDLYESNPPELHATLDTCGMKNVTLTVVLPISDRGRNLGALVLDRCGPEGVTPGAQEAVTRWATAVAPLLGLLESREQWRLAAQRITRAVVEAVESREFDSVGHSAAVADHALRLGRALNLSGRELDELWFAATMHDLGKLHGEEGHALVGANFLHGVGLLSEAQKAVRHHHERWDGQGGPGGLSGEDIPLYARILAASDAGVHGGVAALHAGSGSSLDPRLCALLEKELRRAQTLAPEPPSA